MRVYRRGEDIHRQTASSVFGVPLHMVTAEQRDAAKTINFGLLYGMSAYSLRNKLELDAGIVFTLPQAKRYHRAFFASLPRLKEWIAEVHAFAENNGYVLTWYGRRRPIPWINSIDRKLRGFGERSAVNTTIQGCLQYESRILTNRGMIPIGELHNGLSTAETVWDGEGWRTFDVLNRGAAEHVIVETRDGGVLRCDDRHEVFIHPGAGKEVKYKPLEALKRHTNVAVLNTEVEFYAQYPAFVRGSFEVYTDRDYEDWLYWAGALMSSGVLEERGVTFYIPVAKEEEFLSLQGLCDRHKLVLTHYLERHDTGEGFINCCIHDAALVSFFRSLNLHYTTPLSGTNVPEVVFRSTKVVRKSFINGFFDFITEGADTFVDTSNWHLLQQLRQVIQSLGRHAVVIRLDERKWRLTQMFTYPYLVSTDNRYGATRFREANKLGFIGDTYTLSVHHSNHRFFSDGFLSKNTAADIMKIAIIQCHKAIEERGLSARMLLTVHDQLLFEIREEKMEYEAPILKAAMAVQPKGFVPTVVDADTGKRWGSCKPLVIGGAKPTRNRIQLRMVQGFTVEELKMVRDILKSGEGPYPASVIYQGKIIDAKLTSSESAVQRVLATFEGRVQDVS